MSQRQPVLINGQPLPEGYFLNKWFASRFDANKNVLLVVVGGTGSGKSWSCISIAENWYKYRFPDKKFPINNIVFSLSDGARRIKGDTLQRGEFVIIEEAGVIANSLDFQNKLQKLFSYVLQSVRCKNLGFIFNLPSFSLLNKTARTLAHGVFETTGIKSNYVIMKPKGLQTNAISGKIYPKYLRQVIDGRLITAKRIKVGKPSIELVKPYEELKQNFVEKQIDGLIEGDTPKQKEMEKKIAPLWLAIQQLDKQGKNYTEIGKDLGVTRQAVAKILHVMYEKGIYLPKYQEKAQNIVTSNVLVAP